MTYLVENETAALIVPSRFIAQLHPHFKEVGTFLTLLWFIERFAPDLVTAAVCRLAAQDEARHVAFGMSHLREHINAEPSVRDRLANAVRMRHEELRHTAGLNAEVFDALLLLAAGSWEPANLRRGYEHVSADMHASRKKRLIALGFTIAEAEELSSLHTRNFM